MKVDLPPPVTPTTRRLRVCSASGLRERGEEQELDIAAEYWFDGAVECGLEVVAGRGAVAVDSCRLGGVELRRQCRCAEVSGVVGVTCLS